MPNLNKYIGDLPDNTSLDGTEYVELQKGASGTQGSSQKTTLQKIQAYFKQALTYLESITVGNNLSVDDTDPANPEISLGEQVALYNNKGTYTKPQVISPLVNSAATGTVTPDFAEYSNYEYTVTGSLTISNPSNMSTGQFINMLLVIDAIGGYTITWGDKYKLLNSSSAKTDANTVNILSGYVASDGNIYCNISQ